MKKFIKITTAALVLGCGFGLVGCNQEPPKNGKSAYELAVENGFTGTLEEWLQSLHGKDSTFTPSISISEDGYWVKAEGENIKGEKGQEIEIQFDSQTNKLQWRYKTSNNTNIWQDLTTITNGEDGNLWTTGNSNPDNSEGNNGDFYLNTQDYSLWNKTNDTWTKLTVIKGQDGSTPEIEIGAGNEWYINGSGTGVIAQGINGTDGKEIELSNDNGTIQWRYKTPTNSETWQSLITLTNGQNGKDGSTWTTGTATDMTTVTGNNGDFYLNTDTYELFKKSETTWNSLGIIKGSDGITPNVEIKGNYWYINNVPTSIRATGTKWYIGESFDEVNDQMAGDFFLMENSLVLYQYNSTSKNWQEVGCLKGQPAPTIKAVDVEYVFDQEGNLTVVFIFTMSDDSIIRSSEGIIPQKVKEMSLVGENKILVGQKPTIKLNVTYENDSTDIIDVTDSMFVNNSQYSLIDYNTLGTYSTKIVYRNKIIEQEFVVYDSYAISGIDDITTIEIYDNNKYTINNSTEPAKTYNNIIQASKVISIELSENNIAVLQLNDTDKTATYYTPSGNPQDEFVCEDDYDSNIYTYKFYNNNIVVVSDSTLTITTIYEKDVTSYGEDTPIYIINGRSYFCDGDSLTLADGS